MQRHYVLKYQVKLILEKHVWSDCVSIILLQRRMMLVISGCLVVQLKIKNVCGMELKGVMILLLHLLLVLRIKAQQLDATNTLQTQA